MSSGFYPGGPILSVGIIPVMCCTENSFYLGVHVMAARELIAQQDRGPTGGLILTQVFQSPITASNSTINVWTIGTRVLNESSQNKEECSTPAEIKASIVSRKSEQREVRKGCGGGLPPSSTIVCNLATQNTGSCSVLFCFR